MFHPNLNADLSNIGFHIGYKAIYSTMEIIQKEVEL